MSRRKARKKVDSSNPKDAAETKKFLTVVGITTLVLIVLVFFAMQKC